MIEWLHSESITKTLLAAFSIVYLHSLVTNPREPDIQNQFDRSEKKCQYQSYRHK